MGIGPHRAMRTGWPSVRFAAFSLTTSSPGLMPDTTSTSSAMRLPVFTKRNCAVALVTTNKSSIWPRCTTALAGTRRPTASPTGTNTRPNWPTRKPAVVQRGQMELVFVVTNATAQLRLVKTGKRIADEVEVVSGISPGEEVVRENATNLTDGQPVRITR